MFSKSRLMLSLVVLLLLCTKVAPETDWNYDDDDQYGPSRWGDVYPECKEPKESPINIVRQDVQYDDSLGDFNFTGYDSVNGTIHNDGHTIRFDIDPGQIVEMGGGGLDGKFRLVQFHFHWGMENNTGSEHFLNDKQYPLEVHLVHYSTKYPNISVAADKEDGLAVLGFFFEIGEESTDYKPLIDKLVDVKDPSDPPANLTGLNIKTALGSSSQTFYHYWGTLTTPPCYHSVTWTVFHTKKTISAEQMAVMRSMTKGKNKPIGKNYRPVQPLDDRNITTNNMNVSRQAIPKETTTVGPKDPSKAGPVISACTVLMLAGLTVALFAA